MKNKLCYLFFLAFISCSNPQPKLEIQESIDVNFGKISVGDTVNYSFTLKNTGGTLLEIEQIQPICACTVSQLESKKIKPNETSKLKIKLAGRPEDIGFNDKQIAIRTNSKPVLTVIHLKGNVVR